MKKIHIVIEMYEGEFNKIDRAFADIGEARKRMDLLNRISEKKEISYGEDLSYGIETIDFVEASPDNDSRFPKRIEL